MSKDPKAIIALAAFLALLGILPAQAQRVNIYASADSVTVGERFFVSITAEHNGVADVLFPDPAQGDSVLGDLLIVQRTGYEPRRIAGNDPGARIDSVVYEVATFVLDTAYVPPQPVRFRVAERTYTVGTPPLTILVRSLVPSDAQDIRDLAPLVAFPRPWWFWLLVVLAVLLVNALAAFVIYRWLRKRKERQTPAMLPPVPIRSPYDEAEERLRRLEAMDLHRPDVVKPYFVELSDLVRTYLARRIGIAALEQTTRELVIDLNRMARTGTLPEHTPGQIREVLGLADLVKFADVHPAPAQGYDALRQTRLLVQQVEESQRSPEPVEETTDRPGEREHGQPV